MTNAKSCKPRVDVMACTLLLFLGRVVDAAVLSVTVLGTKGEAVAGAIVVAETDHGYPATRGELTAVMDQRKLMFVPEVLVVRTGTAITFPNSDQVRHQVYSFSGAKVFQLALYSGRTPPPVVFDRAGLVTLGCNIHDGMIGHIYVTDSPWYGRTNPQGVVQLPELPAGNYNIKVWHPRMNERTAQLQQLISLDKVETSELKIQLNKPLRSPTHNHGTDKQWNDY